MLHMALLAEIAEQRGGKLKSVARHYLIGRPIWENKCRKAAMGPEEMARLFGITSNRGLILH